MFANPRYQSHLIAYVRDPTNRYIALWFIDTALKSDDCSAANMPDLQPADYIKITTKFVYAPLFPGITVASMFETPITKTALMRLN
jgi:hypothetical protein